MQQVNMSFTASMGKVVVDGDVKPTIDKAALGGWHFKACLSLPAQLKGMKSVMPQRLYFSDC